MSIQALNWALAQDQIKNSGTRFVLLILSNYANEAGQCYPSRKTIAKKTSMTERSVQTHLNWLADNGYVKWGHRRDKSRQASNLYQIQSEEFSPSQGFQGEGISRSQDSQGENCDISQGEGVSPNTKEEEPLRNTQTLADDGEVASENPEGGWGWPVQPLLDAFPEYLADRLTPSMVGFIVGDVLPGDEVAWERTIEMYRMNFDPVLKRYLPDKIGNLISYFRNEKLKLEREKNAVNNRYRGTSGTRTDQDVLAESAEFYQKYPA